MPFIFIHNKLDPNVPYQGHNLPADKKPVTVPVPDPNVPYAGHNLPADKVAPVQFSDPSNTPGVIIIGGVQLPPDTMVAMLNGEKILAMSKILDGPTVFERIAREPYEIEFEAVLRMQSINGTTYRNTTPPAGLNGVPDNVFAQEYLHDVWNNIWLPDTVQTIQNSYLNNLGIQEIIIKSISPATIRGSKNIPLRMRAYENVPGQSLIILSNQTTSTAL